MNIHSIFFKLNILFVIAMLATIVAGLLTVAHMSRKEQTELLIKSRLLIREQRISRSRPVKLAKELGLIEVKPKTVSKILRRMRQNKRVQVPKPLHFGASHVFFHNGHFWLWIHTKKFKMLLRQRESLWKNLTIPFLIFGGMLALMALMYWLIRRSLLPIKTLQKDIISYGEGIFPQKHLPIEGSGEIAEVANAFYASAERVQRLSRSRELFVRNIFHELNTPVTKGKILAELVDEPKTKDMLESIFGRLEALLRELAQMEKITSQDVELHMKRLRAIELIDQARDLLYIDEPIETNISDETIVADFSMMSIVFKNLIDNARKYGSNLYIRYRDGDMDFISEGKPLEHPLGYYIEPFASGGQRSKDGFGLGLYIVNEILKKHGYKFSYHHENGRNIFTIAKER